jgi:hypothetical protein
MVMGMPFHAVAKRDMHTVKEAYDLDMKDHEGLLMVYKQASFRC